MRNSTLPQLDEIALASRLNPQPRTPLGSTAEIRAAARLQQITATPRQIVGARQATPKVRALRWAAIPVAAAAALGISVVLPGSPTLTPAQALTTWQAVPGDGSNVDLAAADAACLAAVDEMIADPWLTLENRPDLGAEPILLETRGEWATIAYTGANNEFTSCLLWTPDGQPPVVAVAHVSPRDAMSTIWGSYVNDDFDFDAVLNQSSDVGWAEVPAADAAQFIEGTQGVNLTDDDGFSSVVGRVGSDVVGLVLHTYTAGDVEASISDGWYTAWWPGPFGGPSYCLGQVDPDTGTSKNFGCNIADTMTITLRDGSSRTVRFDSPENLLNDEWGVNNDSFTNPQPDESTIAREAGDEGWVRISEDNQ